MRMRKKKNLAPRLSACADYFLPAETDDLNYESVSAGPAYFDLGDVFGRQAPLYLEIGAGKGQFICQMAARFPERNFIAVEKVSNVIVTAAETAQSMGLTNVRFARCGAEYLERFLPPHSVSGIYLNFSSPYPKNSYESHRLTNRKFLEIYRNLLKPGAVIEQKTDNMHFFEYSIEQFSAAGYRLRNISLDLHNSSFEGNIVTEYEARFSSQGFPIYRLEAYLKEEAQ